MPKEFQLNVNISGFFLLGRTNGTAKLHTLCVQGDPADPHIPSIIVSGDFTDPPQPSTQKIMRIDGGVLDFSLLQTTGGIDLTFSEGVANISDILADKTGRKLIQQQYLQNNPVGPVTASCVFGAGSMAAARYLTQWTIPTMAGAQDYILGRDVMWTMTVIGDSLDLPALCVSTNKPLSLEKLLPQPVGGGYELSITLSNVEWDGNQPRETPVEPPSPGSTGSHLPFLYPLFEPSTVAATAIPVFDCVVAEPHNLSAPAGARGMRLMGSDPFLCMLGGGDG